MPKVMRIVDVENVDYLFWISASEIANCAGG
jgi:hypothetical protein